MARPTAPAAALLLAALSLTACGEDETNAADQPADSETSANTGTGAAGDILDFQDVSGDLQGRVGEEITVRATVEDVVTPEVFTLTDPADTTLDPIVVVDQDPTEVVETGTEVVVTATVRDEFVSSEIEDLLKIQLDDELLGDFEEGPYLDASEVRTEPAGD